MLESSIFKILLVVIVAVIAIGLLKRAIKGAVIIISIFILILFGYNFIILNQSPAKTAENLKNDAVYIKSISEQTINVQKDLKNMVSILSENDVSAENDLIYYIDDLKNIKDEVNNLEHSKSLNKLNESYCNKLNNIISVSENIDDNMKAIDKLNSLSSSIKEVSNKIKDIK